ncbi:hypothetical protein OsI_26183 [Oryza sativa Indica Group]|uniref:Uncharacterized protein n=1 Tax=Oryza sativa subsp. indica TaxID=39946 RepID=B8B6M0_ORYSI|nr:hypothetical protein OsI_26183 [Oryza sativa Indica Group]
MDSRDDDARWRQLGPLLHARDLAPADLDAALALARAYAAMERFDLAARECERALALALADDTAAAAAEEELLHLQLEPPPTKEARMLAKERLRFLLLQASSKAVAMAARDRWRAAMAAATADDDERRRLPDDEFFPDLQRSPLLVPERISEEQEAELIGSCAVKLAPSDDDDDDESERFLSKIKSTLQRIKDRKALSVDLLDNLVEFTNRWTIEEETAAAAASADPPQNPICSIAKLHPVALHVLALTLDMIVPGFFERSTMPGLSAGDDDAKLQDSYDHFDYVSVVREDFVPSIVVEEDALRIIIDGSSSNQDALFRWLSRPRRQDPVTSWNNMRRACLDNGARVLEKLIASAAALVEKIELKRGLIEMNTHESYFTKKAKLDIEILQLDAEVDDLKKKLVEVCTCDYRKVSLPAMKDYLWDKLRDDPPEKVLCSEDGLNIGTPEVYIQSYQDDEKGAKDNPKGGELEIQLRLTIYNSVVEELPGDMRGLV